MKQQCHRDMQATDTQWIADIFYNRLMVSCAESALTGAEKQNKEQMCKRPIKVTVNVTLRFCCPEELCLKAIKSVQIYEKCLTKGACEVFTCA